MDFMTSAMIRSYVKRPADHTARMVLADRLNDVGRWQEEEFLRGTSEEALQMCGLIVPAPYTPGETNHYLDLGCAMCVLNLWHLAVDRIKAARPFADHLVSDRYWRDQTQHLESLLVLFDSQSPTANERTRPYSHRTTSNMIYGDLNAMRRALPLNFDLFHLCLF